MSYDLDRDPSKEPSLAEMTTKAMEVLSKNSKGYFLMVEGGRIDHALHETTAKKALQDMVAFDNAIKAAIAKAKVADPDLKNTLIVVTADHDHTLVLNGYAKRTGKTSSTNPGVLGVVKIMSLVPQTRIWMACLIPSSVLVMVKTARKGPRSILVGFDETMTSANTYHQEAVIRVGAGSETHGGTDVFLGAIGKGADTFMGTIDNTKVYSLVKKPQWVCKQIAHTKVLLHNESRRIKYETNSLSSSDCQRFCWQRHGASARYCKTSSSSSAMAWAINDHGISHLQIWRRWQLDDG